MRKFMLLVTLFVLIQAKVMSISYYKYQLSHLSKEQVKVLRMTWYKAKEFNLQYTMSAIAFKESSLGRTKINLNDGELGSFGVFHNLIKSVYDRYVVDKPKDRNKIMSIKLALAKRLIDDYDFSFSQSLAELKYWENVAIIKGKEWDKWRFMIMSYNGGTYGYSEKLGYEYYKNIVNIIKALKQIKYKYKLK